MNTRPKILAFAGSLRKDSYNKKLIKIAVESARKAGGEVTLIDLKDYPLPIYDQEIEDSKGLPENALKLKKLFLENQGLLISSPEYNSSITGVLKNVIDWVSRPTTPDEISLKCFINKVAVLMSASPGDLGGLRGLVHLRAILQNIKVLTLPEQLIIPQAMDAFTSEGFLKDIKKQTSAEALGSKLVLFLEKIEKASLLV